MRNIPLNYWSPFVEGKESREAQTLGVWQGGRNLLDTRLRVLS